jgi:hypothetical protein
MFDFSKIKGKKNLPGGHLKKSITGQQHWSKLKTVHVFVI